VCFKIQGDSNYGSYNHQSPYRVFHVPVNQEVKLLDSNHATHMFVGNSNTGGDHQVYACKQSGFAQENFHKRTGMVVTQTNEGYYQIRDQDHQAYIYVGNDLDNGGDHIVWACAQQNWKDYNDFMFRTSWSIVPAGNGFWRFVDRKHNSYLFIGNSNDGGDHTVFSVPTAKYNNNPNEWAVRTVFDIQGGVITPVVPVNRNIKFFDVNHNTFCFVGNSETGGDHQVYGCKQEGFQIQNFHKRTPLVITQTNEGYFQIKDVDHQAFLYVGNDLDNGGDHTIWACAQQNWKDYNDFMFRTSWSLVPAENGFWRFLDRKHNSYMFVGNSNDGGDHTFYSVPTAKFNNNPGEWAKRTLFDLCWEL